MHISCDFEAASAVEVTVTFPQAAVDAIMEVTEDA